MGRQFMKKQTKEKISNAREGVPSCDKCGNPLKMFWCSACCHNSEKCESCWGCGKIMSIDRDYHVACE